MSLSGSSNNSVAFYPSCNHPATRLISLSASSIGLTVPVTQSLACINLPNNLQSLIARMLRNSISPGYGRHFSVADVGTTNHMFPNKLAFISHKTISNLQVWMGNNSYLPVLGQGTSIISLNGQRILVQNVHGSGLTILLCSLCKHLKQHGCGFWGAYEAGRLVYFPQFVLMVDTLLDCRLSYEPLGWRPSWTPATMCSHAVLRLCNLPTNLICHAWSPILRSSFRMTLLLMGL